MSRALGWWRHAALTGLASGLLASPALPAPGGWLPCLLAGCGALAWLSHRRRDGPSPGAVAPWLTCLAALGALAGIGLGGARLDAIASGALHGPVGAKVEVDGIVVGVSRRSFSEVRVPVETPEGRVLVVAREPVADLATGAAVHAEGRLSHPDDPFRSAETERSGAELILDAKGIATRPGGRGGLSGALDRVRSRAEGALSTGMDAEQSALARGFVLGQDDRIDPVTREAFRRSGLSHLLAVSGQNVMLLAILGGVVFALFGAGLRMRLALTLLLIAAYVPVAGAGASIERAAVMGAAGILATLAGRPTDRAYAALLAACVTLLINPRFGSDAGWRLSFAAIVGIMVWGSPLRELLGGSLRRRLPERLARPLAEGAALTIAATVATAPLIAHDFDQLSVAALPANLAVLPLVAPVMWVGMTIGLLGQLPRVTVGPVDPLALLGGLEARLVDLIAAVARLFGDPAWAQVELSLSSTPATVALYALMATGLSTTIVVLRRRRRLGPAPTISFALAVVALVALLPAVLDGGVGRRALPPRTLRITELDVGQGDAILLQPPRGAPILVDGGPPGAAAAEGLRELGVDHLRAAFVTHDELDHAGGMPAVLGAVRVDLLVDALAAPEIEAVARGSRVRVIEAAEGSSFDFGALELDVLWPPRERLDAPSENRNFDAIVLVARFGGYDALLSSDAEQEATHLDPGPLDVVKLAHHGSDDAGLESLLERSVPRVALISVGADNSYGHPTEETMATLAEHGVCALRTDLDGPISVELGPAGVNAATAAGPPPGDRPGCSP